MRQKSRTCVGASGLLILVGLVGLSAGCAFDVSARDLDLLPLPNAPVADLTSSDADVVFEDPGTIAVYHGFGCAESDRRGTEVFLKLAQDITVPPYVTAATVFLNGWRMKYLRSDHEIGGMFVSLGAIRLSQGTLSWQAVGALSDQNFDDAYSLCYYFTAIGWNSSNLAVIADHEDEENHQTINATHDNTTALKVPPGFLQDSSYPAGVRAALLPRGFGAEWRGSGVRLPDHHLFQVAYNLDYAERYVDSQKKYGTFGQPSLPSPASHVDVNVITRDSKTIFKDNALRRNHASGEAVSVLLGADVGYVQPPFSVLPREDLGVFSCISGPVSSTSEIVVENVPFTYAIPVLTGWNLGYGCDDEHVTEMGVWLDTFRYTRPVVSLGGGTLRYTFSHVLRDRNGRRGSFATQRVHILGFKPILTQGPGDGPVR